MIVSHLRDSDGQVADKERQEDGEHHLGDPPLIAPRLRLSVVFDCRPLVCAVVECARTRVLGSLVFPHSLF